MYSLLIIEDEPLIRKGILTLIDYDRLNISSCYEAEDGQEGLEQFVAHSPDLVLLDINLPHMNGIQLAEQFKQLKPQVKIAILTGYDYFDYAVLALRIGVDNYILKPVNKNDISAILKGLIEKLEQEHIQKEVSRSVDALYPLDNKTAENKDDYRKLIHEILIENLGNADFSLQRLAQELNLNSSYLSTLFKKLFAMPFQDFMLNLRLERAKLLLLTSHLRIYEIAEKVGFEDVNYFSTRFKKVYGLSPKQFLQNVRDGHDQN